MELPRTRKNHTRDRGIAKAGAHTTRQLQRPSREQLIESHGATARALRHARSPQKVHPRAAKTQKASSFCTSTMPIPAEGRAGRSESAKQPRVSEPRPRRPRRGSRGQIRNRKKPRVVAPRPRRSPQSVARAEQKSQKTSRFCTSTTPIPQRVHPRTANTQKTSSFCTSTTPIPAEGRASRLEIAKGLEFLHLNPRTAKTQKASSFLPRPRRSPQRVARADQKSQKTSTFCTSPTPISGGSRGQIRNRKKPRVFAPRKPDPRSMSCPGALES